MALYNLRLLSKMNLQIKGKFDEREKLRAGSLGQGAGSVEQG